MARDHSPGPPLLARGLTRLSQQSETIQNLTDSFLGQQADVLTQLTLINRKDLRHDYDARLGQIAFACFE
jgi:hypothetical protein